MPVIITGLYTRLHADNIRAIKYAGHGAEPSRPICVYVAIFRNYIIESIGIEACPVGGAAGCHHCVTVTYYYRGQCG